MPVKTICCVCHKTKDLNGWLDQFLEQYKRLSHGYCPECFKKTITQIQMGENRSKIRSRDITKNLETKKTAIR